MLTPGQVINQRYQLLEKLGKNAGRQTWLARDLQSQNSESSDSENAIASSKVVVKFLAFGGDVRWEDLKLFEREGQILKQLDHDRIPRYHDYFSLEEKYLWFGLVQAHIPGISLKQLLDEGKRFSELEVEKIAREILTILVYLHNSQPPILHRDIKPSNLILGTDNHIYLVDFGAVQDRAATEGSTFTVVGTYGYAPMEQFGGKSVPASDLYALGATLIHLLTRTSPAELPTKNLTLQFRDRTSIKPQLAEWLEKITSPAVERRYQSAQQALRAWNEATSKNQPQISFNRELSKKNRNLDSVLISRRVKINHNPNHLEIEISPQGIRSMAGGNSNSLIPIFLSFMLLGGLSTIVLRSSIVLLFIFYSVVFYFTCYPYLESLFCNTKVTMSNRRFSIEKRFWNGTKIDEELIGNIIDISVNYQAMKVRTNTNDSGDIITINTKISNKYREYQQFTFGKKLSEKEAIRIASEIRLWLENR